MNILYISSKKRWGGVVSWMVKTAIGLEKKDHKVFVLSHPNSKLNKAENKPNIRLVEKKLGATYSPLTILYLVKFIKKNKVDLLVTNIDKEVGIGGMAARICGIPNIRRVGREDDFNNRFRMKWNHILLTDKSIVPCNYLSDFISKNYEYTKIEDFKTVYNGRNKQFISEREINKQREKWGVFSSNQIVIGVTCQLTKVKYIDHLIEVFNILNNKYDNLKLVITGEGPRKKELIDYSKKLKLEKNIVFAGFSNNPMLTAASYDIATLVSKSEGFPNSIVEYCATGKAVVATDVGGNSEIIKNDINGFLIPFGNIELIASKIEELILNKELKTKFEKNTIKLLEENFTEDIMINELETFFKELMR